MPELPEVETIRRNLLEKVKGLKVQRIELLSPKFIEFPGPEEFAARLGGKTLSDITRRGKYLVLRFCDGAGAAPGGEAGVEECVVVHLKMAGRLIACRGGEPIVKHTHVIFHLSDGWELRYIDLRHFGRLAILATAAPSARGTLDEDPGTLEKGLGALGIEPLSPEFTPEWLGQFLSRRGGRIKAVLLDQHAIAGLGNIYVDEALFEAGIHPERKASGLTPGEVTALHKAIRVILKQAIDFRGTTILTYVDGEGRRGEFAAKLKVYRKHGQPCPRCGTVIERAVVAGRGTHFCPRCQRRR